MDGRGGIGWSEIKRTNRRKREERRAAAARGAASSSSSEGEGSNKYSNNAYAKQDRSGHRGRHGQGVKCDASGHYHTSSRKRSALLQLSRSRPSHATLYRVRRGHRRSPREPDTFMINRSRLSSVGKERSGDGTWRVAVGPMGYVCSMGTSAMT